MKQEEWIDVPTTVCFCVCLACAAPDSKHVTGRLGAHCMFQL